ncbi:MAG: AAA family ATPase, partial [Solirubrobacteraceae bacterium]
MRFIGRDHELQRLQTRLESSRRTGQGEFIAMRGRRRVGKSRLVEEFAQRAGVPYVFYTAVQERPERELARFLDA